MQPVDSPRLTLPERPRWYALYVCSRHEKRVAERLTLRAVEHFLPTYKSIHRWKNGCRMLLDLPLFPGYVFTKISSSQRSQVLNCPGALWFVTCGQEPVALEDAEVEGLKLGLTKCTAKPHPYLHTGNYVLVRSGPFAGMVGILMREKNNFRVVISVKMIASSVAVELDYADLDPLPVQLGAVAGR
jgi:transcription antitermination factor NusG